MDETIEEVPRALAVPAWFRIASWVALAWELFGCAAFVVQMTTAPETLPVDQQRLWAATPIWMTAAYTLAVLSGLAGAVQLLRRKIGAPGLLLVSLIAVIVQFSALMIDPRLRQLTSDDMLTGPMIIILACYAIFQLALVAGRRGWLD